MEKSQRRFRSSEIPTLTEPSDNGSTDVNPTSVGWDPESEVTSITSHVPTSTPNRLNVPPSSTAVINGNTSDAPKSQQTYQSQDIVSTSIPTISPVTTEPSSNGGSNLSGGAVAGVAIASLIVGAILAFAAAFFLFRRRSKPHNDPSNYNPYDDSTPELVMMQKSSGRSNSYVQVSQTPLPAPIHHASSPVSPVQPIANSSDILASVLPAAAHEGEIQSRLAALFNQIHRHVETYYRDVHASITPSMEPDLARFGSAEVNMAELLSACSSATTAIKHALMAYVLSITGPVYRKDRETLFPAELSGREKGREGGSVSVPSDPILSIATSLHRRLSVLLYTHSPSSTPSTSISTTREAAEHFCLTFFPWVNPSADDTEKENDLTRIIAEALDTRIWLFGQPSEFEFRWETRGRGVVVVAPEVVRLDIDERGGDGNGGGKVVVEMKVMGL